MTLTDGPNLLHKFGPDEIQSHLGGGGMGERAKAPEIRGSIASSRLFTFLHPQNACPPRTGQGTWTIIRGTLVAFFWARQIHARFSQIRLEAREIRAAARRAWFVGENAYGKF